MPDTVQPEDKAVLNSNKPQQKSSDNVLEKKNEYGGPKGKEPTRYGDWEKKGRCIDF